MYPVINEFGTIIFTRTSLNEAIKDASTLAKKNKLKYYVCSPRIEISPPEQEVKITYLEVQ